MRSTKQLLKRRAAIAKQLPIVEMIRGTLLKRYLECMRANCKCHKGAKYRHGPYYFLSIGRKDKSFHVYVPKKMLKEVKKWVINYERVWKGIEEITDINTKVIRLTGK